ncbi:uncharacterized protein V6R79_024734 [Siganus canaliculatus]
MTSPTTDKPRHTPADCRTGNVRFIRARQPLSRADRRPEDGPGPSLAHQHQAETFRHALTGGYFQLVPQISIIGPPVKKAIGRCRFVDVTMTLEDDLTTAAATGNTADVEFLLQAGAEVNGLNCFGQSALQVMMMGSTPVAQVLLKHGADPNVTDRFTGSTPLHDAARTGFLDTVKLLVLFLADPQAMDKTNRLPIDLAKENGHSGVVAFLESL